MTADFASDYFETPALEPDPAHVQPRFFGPLEQGLWPQTLRARVVTPGDRPRVHGYDIEADLSRHYRWSDLVLLALTGELPTDHATAAFEVACLFLAPVSVAHASTHAAVLAHLCGATTSSTGGVAAIGLGEQARRLLDDHETLLQWLREPSDELPSAYRATNAADKASIERLFAAMAATGLTVQALALRPTRAAALISVLYACGLTRREQIEAAILIARLPIALAEALSERVANFREYPVNLPPFVYEDSP